MKQWFTLWALLFLGFFSQAQTARVQIIHNSPTPGTSSGPVVDIYVNGLLLAPLTAVPFRQATPFLDVPADVDLTVDIKVSPSTPADPAVATFPIGSLADGGTYVVTAAGIVGDPVTPFNLYVNATAQESAADPALVDVAVFHGSPDAPAVDVDARLVGNLLSDLAFGEYQGYLSVGPALYYLDVRAAGDPNIVATFAADLSGLAGGAATVFASGLLGNTPAFGLFAALPDGTVVELPASPVARMQIIHNSPSPTVDVWVNGAPLLTDFAFRTATPFIFVPAETPLDLSIVPAGGDPVNDNVYTGGPVTLENGQTYVATAAGIVGDPVTPFNLYVNPTAQESAADPALVDVAVFHGSPDAPAVDVDARLVGNLLGNLAFGEYQGYLSVPAALYYLDIRAAGDPNIVATFAADLSGLAGGAATVFASGLLGGTPAFGLFAALPDGTVVELPASPVARMQIIHNSPSPTVDVWVNGAPLLTDFAFRSATPFIFVPAETPLDLSVVPAGGDPVNDNVYTGGPVTLDNGQTYVVVADGIVGNPVFPFTLHIQADSREAADDPALVDFSLLHGSPGAPPVDVEAFGVVTGTLASDLAYGNFSGYVSAPAAPYFISVVVPSLGAEIPFYVNLTGLDGGAATVFASGLVTGNPDFGIFAALPDGTVVEFPQISEFAQVNVIHNSPSAAAGEVDLYLNGGLLVDNFAFRTATGFVELPAGLPLDIGVAPATSTSVADTIANFNFPSLAADENYIVTAAGLVGDPDNPFTLQIFAGARDEAAVAGNVDILALHSSPGAPAVDINARSVGNLVSDLSYGEYAGYLEVPADLYFLDIRAAGSPDIVATFFAPLFLLEDEAVTVFASGILGGTPAFGLFAANADGDVFELEATEISRTQIIHNSPAPTVDIYLGGDLAFEAVAFRQATPYVFTPANVEVQVTIVPAGGNPSTDAVFDAPVVFGQNGQTLVVVASGIVGDPTTPFTLNVFGGGRESADQGGVDLLLYHGSTDAPEVDVVAADGGPIVFDNIAYGEFSGDYVTVDALAYELDITPADDNSTIVATYGADLTSLEGGAAVVFASGFLSGDDPAFGVWVALPDGTTFPLPLILSTNEVLGLNGWSLSPNPAVPGSIVDLQLDIESQDWARIQLLDASGKIVRPVFEGQLISGQSAMTIETGGLTPGMYFVQLITQKGAAVQKLVLTR